MCVCGERERETEVKKHICSAKSCQGKITIVCYFLPPQIFPSSLLSLSASLSPLFLWPTCFSCSLKIPACEEKWESSDPKIYIKNFKTHLEAFGYCSTLVSPDRQKNSRPLAKGHKPIPVLVAGPTFSFSFVTFTVDLYGKISRVASSRKQVLFTSSDWFYFHCSRVFISLTYTFHLNSPSLSFSPAHLLFFRGILCTEQKVSSANSSETHRLSPSRQAGPDLYVDIRRCRILFHWANEFQMGSCY